MDSDLEEIVIAPKRIVKKKKVTISKLNNKQINVLCQRSNSNKNLPRLKDFVEIIQSLVQSWFNLQCTLYKDFDFTFICSIKTPHRHVEFNIAGEFDNDEFEEIKDSLQSCLFVLKFMNMEVTYQ